MKFIYKTILLLLLLGYNVSFANTITAIIPFSPGGGTDISMRHLQKYLLDVKNIKVNFVFRPGADTIIGSTELNNSPKNGSVVGFTGITGLAAAINTGLEFEYVSATRKYTQVLVTHNSLNIKDYSDLLKKANQGTVFSYGYVSPAQLFQYEQLITFEKIKNKPTLIPYKGGSQLVNDLLGNHINLAMIPIIIAKPHIESGKIKVLATDKSLKDYPNIPVLSEKFPSWEEIGGYCIVFPKGTDQKVVSEWRSIIKEYLENPQTIKDFKEEYSEAYPTGEKFLKNLLGSLKHIIK